MRDRRDLRVGGGQSSQERAQSYLRAYKGQLDYNGKRQERTTSQTPGTGGMTQGLGIQQERQRQIGEDKQRAKDLRPDMDDNLYDIYD